MESKAVEYSFILLVHSESQLDQEILLVEVYSKDLYMKSYEF